VTPSGALAWVALLLPSGCRLGYPRRPSGLQTSGPPFWGVPLADSLAGGPGLTRPLPPRLCLLSRALFRPLWGPGLTPWGPSCQLWIF
jgi:hypothetical protein